MFRPIFVGAVVLSVCSAAPPLLALEVSEGSYTVRIAGKPWLQSGALRFFANGEWHAVRTTAPPPPSPICSAGKASVDIAAGDFHASFGNATDASCCAACAAAPRACNGWARTTVAESPRVPKNTCFLIEHARGYKPSASRTAHIIDSTAPTIPQITGTLTMTAPASHPAAGSDRFGSYTKVTVPWLATSSQGATTRFATSFRTYSDGRTLVFEQGIASGAKRTNHKNVSFADGVHGELASLEPYPFLQFPSFNVTHRDNSIFTGPHPAAFTTWQGTMVLGHGPFTGAPCSADLGLSGGPVVVFDGLENGGENHAVVISPASHFKGATMLRWGDDWTIGMSGEITEVPPGFTHETILVSGSGVTATMDAFGALMRAAHQTKKVYDRAVEKMGYWTDNGAYYYGDAYPQHDDVPGDTRANFNLTCCTKQKLIAAKRALDVDDVPMSYIQLDDWCVPSLDSAILAPCFRCSNLLSPQSPSSLSPSSPGGTRAHTQ